MGFTPPTGTSPTQVVGVCLRVSKVTGEGYRRLPTTSKGGRGARHVAKDTSGSDERRSGQIASNGTYSGRGSLDNCIRSDTDLCPIARATPYRGLKRQWQTIPIQSLTSRYHLRRSNRRS